MQGGQKDNAITREAVAELLIDGAQAEAVKAYAAKVQAGLREEYEGSDSGITIQITEGDVEQAMILHPTSREKVLFYLMEVPFGIQKMSGSIKGLVETSLNLGVLTLEKDKLTLQYAVRSAVGTAKEYLLKRIAALVEEFGGRVTNTGNYPAWEYRRDSVLRDDMVRIFKEMYGKEPTVEAIHAGLECGILAGKIDGLDAVSIGPDMIAIHTTEEKLSISSTKRVWDYILKVIACK